MITDGDLGLAMINRTIELAEERARELGFSSIEEALRKGRQ